MAPGEVSVSIDAPPDRVYALVSDVARTPEWSPECVRVEWVEAGKRFRGHNKIGSREWAMECVIDEAKPSQAFAFHTERDGDLRTRWGYRLEPTSSGGTQLTEWYQRVAKVPLPARIAERLLMGGRAKHNAENMRASLAKIKTIAEAAG
jgi:uncharacterized protein YndB with AHSA1/START domain